MKPKTLVETLDHGNPQSYLGIYVAVITLLTYPVSTCTAGRSVKRLISSALAKYHDKREIELFSNFAHSQARGRGN